VDITPVYRTFLGYYTFVIPQSPFQLYLNLDEFWLDFGFVFYVRFKVLYVNIHFNFSFLSFLFSSQKYGCLWLLLWLLSFWKVLIQWSIDYRRESAFIGFSHSSNQSGWLSNVLPSILVGYSTASSAFLHALAVPAVALSPLFLDHKKKDGTQIFRILQPRNLVASAASYHLLFHAIRVRLIYIITRLFDWWIVRFYWILEVFI